MARYAPIARTCQRCGEKGTTDNITPTISFVLNSETFGSIHMKKWKNYCDPCEKEVKEIINAHITNLDFSILSNPPID